MLKKYILFSFSLCVSSVAVAQQNPLLEKYRSMAVEYSHDLKAADKNIAASIELEKAAQKDLYPKLSGNANFQYTGNPLELTLDLPSTGTPATFEGKDLKYGASVSLTQPIYTGGRLLETIRLAKYRHNVSGFQEEYIRSGIYLQTDIQYWNTVARTEIVRISDDYRNSVAFLTQTIRERVDAGLTDKQDLLMMEVRLNEAEYQLLQARKNLENGLMALNSLIGVELGTPTEVEDSVAMVVVDDVSLWSDVGSVRPELKIATEQIRIAGSEKKMALSKYSPQFYIGVDGSYSSPGYDFRTDMDPNYAVYAKVAVPIFEWGKRRNERRASDFRVDMATDNLNKVKDGVDLEIQTARNSLRQAMEQVELTRNSLDKARENETMALDRYDEGKSSVIELIDAQTYRQMAQMNHVQAKVSAQNYYSELLKALNKY
ncbi:TolC family protein [Bacteroides salyersiae]|uniref:TolC family protein n=1 Tax=Bacteroides salyersiae TaxID=291644 RepID=UPI00189B41BE|nr:TolC family protein [Bacteroides salyersiae]